MVAIAIVAKDATGKKFGSWWGWERKEKQRKGKESVLKGSFVQIEMANKAAVIMRLKLCVA